MFDHIETTVLLGDEVVFQFPHPVSISRLWVATEAGKVWDFISDLFAPATILGSSMQFWPADEAPSDILSMLDKVKAAQQRELIERGPRYPLLSSVTYGVVPLGYHSTLAAQPLIPNEYAVGFFAEQGIGGARFVVPPQSALQSDPHR